MERREFLRASTLAMAALLLPVSLVLPKEKVAEVAVELSTGGSFLCDKLWAKGLWTEVFKQTQMAHFYKKGTI